MNSSHRLLSIILATHFSGCARSDAPTYHLFTASEGKYEGADVADQALDLSVDMEVDMMAPEPNQPMSACTEELCDALDNDCDGVVDEEITCACSDDTSCYGGPPETRGVGLCQDGVRACVDDDSWGVCEGWIEPAEELCDGEDNDCDGENDEGLLNPCGGCGNLPLETCDGEDNDCDGAIDEGLINACGICGAAPIEICDGDDNDCDGVIDEGRRNACGFCGTLPEEVCDLVDNDCDGAVDEQACVIAEINVEGDCTTVSCPPEAPHPIGCQIDFQGDDSRGCVAHQPGESSVYLQEGTYCGSGQVVGSLTCSSIQMGEINANSCPINRSEALYPSHQRDCP